MGSGTKTIATTKQYNDGKWHKIVAIREGAKGRLSVDGQEARDVTKPISGSTIDHIETISFGGYPNKHNHPEVTEMKFDGCINNVTIMGQPVDLRVNIKTFDVLPGCPDKVNLQFFLIIKIFVFYFNFSLNQWYHSLNNVLVT